MPEHQVRCEIDRLPACCRLACPGSAARELASGGREERIEDPGLRVQRHAAARVGDFQLNVLFRRQAVRAALPADTIEPVLTSMCRQR
jgi:hypothetical protein